MIKKYFNCRKARMYVRICHLCNEFEHANLTTTRQSTQWTPGVKITKNS